MCCGTTGGMRVTRLIWGRVGCRFSSRRFACNSVETTQEKISYAFPITPFRSEEDWKAMRTGDPFPGDPNADLKNFDLAVKRAHDVVQAMTEKRNTKLLHLYCGYGFVEHFGQVNKEYSEYVLFFTPHRAPILRLLAVVTIKKLSML